MGAKRTQIKVRGRGPRSFAREVKTRHFKIFEYFGKIFKYLENSTRILKIFYEKFQTGTLASKIIPERRVFLRLPCGVQGVHPSLLVYSRGQIKIKIELLSESNHALPPHVISARTAPRYKIKVRRFPRTKTFDGGDRKKPALVALDTFGG